MRKIIFLFILVIAIAFISGRKQSVQNAIAEKYAKTATLKKFKTIGNPETFTLKKSPEDSPGILLILNNDTGSAAWTPSLWWSYRHNSAKNTGC